MHENTEIRRDLQNISYCAGAMDMPMAAMPRYIVIPAGIEFFHITESATGIVKGFRRSHIGACDLARWLEQDVPADSQGQSSRLCAAQQFDPCQLAGERFFPSGKSRPTPLTVDQDDPAGTHANGLQACRDTATDHHRHIDPIAHHRLAS